MEFQHHREPTDKFACCSFLFVSVVSYRHYIGVWQISHTYWFLWFKIRINIHYGMYVHIFLTPHYQCMLSQACWWHKLIKNTHYAMQQMSCFNNVFDYFFSPNHFNCYAQATPCPGRKHCICSYAELLSSELHLRDYSSKQHPPPPPPPLFPRASNRILQVKLVSGMFAGVLAVIILTG